MLACEFGHVGIVEILLAGPGIDVDLQNNVRISMRLQLPVCQRYTYFMLLLGWLYCPYVRLQEWPRWHSANVAGCSWC